MDGRITTSLASLAALHASSSRLHVNVSIGANNVSQDCDKRTDRQVLRLSF